jgi:hypothetical protein
MSTCTTTPEATLTAPAPATSTDTLTPPQAHGSVLAGTADRSSQAQAIRSTLDAAADLINTQHAQVLASVIAMKEANLHRSAFGFSALRDLLLSQFDFTFNTAGSIAAIAKLSGKFQILTQAAVSGKARIDQVAYAVRQLDRTTAMRLFAKTPFQAPVASPFDATVECATPEAMVSEYCAHAPFKDLRRHLEELWAAISEETELVDALGEQSLQRLELVETGNGMWHLEGELTATTGRLLDKYLKTACPPPRKDETDTDGVLPPQANRHAEALHQLLAGYGSSPQAATRHGHTATLHLLVDIATLQGQDTGRVPLLEGRPISLALARLLACETRALPGVFDYAAGEAVELGRALRLPNIALRKKLELEQPDGCAWSGCDRPVAWTEAHHIQHWADGGDTNAANLILLCRFHHGRIHTPGWTVQKTGPGQAVITHHEGHENTTSAASTASAAAGEVATGCGCSDWRTDQDMDAQNRSAEWDLFPTGLYRSEWSEMLKPDLGGYADLIESDRAVKAMREAKAKARERFQTEQARQAEQAGQADPGESAEPSEAATSTTPVTPIVEANTEAPLRKTVALTGPVERVMAVEPVGPVDYGEPPFLRCPSGRPLGDARPPNITERHAQPEPHRGRAPQHVQTRKPQDTPALHLVIAASSDRDSPHIESRKPAEKSPLLATALHHDHHPSPGRRPHPRDSSHFCRRPPSPTPSDIPTTPSPPRRTHRFAAAALTATIRHLEVREGPAAVAARPHRHQPPLRSRRLDPHTRPPPHRRPP